MLTPWRTGQIGVRGGDSGVPTAPGFGPDSVAPINPHRTRKPPPANRRGPSCVVKRGHARTTCGSLAEPHICRGA